MTTPQPRDEHRTREGFVDVGVGVVQPGAACPTGWTCGLRLSTPQAHSLGNLYGLASLIVIGGTDCGSGGLTSGNSEGVTSMFLGAWCGQMGLAGWILMGLFWATFLGLVLWALSQLFPGPRGDDGVHEDVDDLDQQSARGQIYPLRIPDPARGLTSSGRH